MFIIHLFKSCQVISLKVPVPRIPRSKWFDVCFRRSCSSLKASRCPSTCGHMQRPSVLGLTNSNCSLLMVGCKVERRENPTKFWSSWCFQVFFFNFHSFLPGGMIQFDYIHHIFSNGLAQPPIGDVSDVFLLNLLLPEERSIFFSISSCQSINVNPSPLVRFPPFAISTLRCSFDDVTQVAHEPEQEWMTSAFNGGDQTRPKPDKHGRNFTQPKD